MDGGASSLASPSSSKQSLLAALSLSERLGGFLSSADILGLLFLFVVGKARNLILKKNFERRSGG